MKRTPDWFNPSYFTPEEVEGMLQYVIPTRYDLFCMQLRLIELRLLESSFDDTAQRIIGQLEEANQLLINHLSGDQQ